MSMTESLMTPAGASLQTDQKNTTQHNTSNNIYLHPSRLVLCQSISKRKKHFCAKLEQTFLCIRNHLRYKIFFNHSTRLRCSKLLPALGVFYCFIVMRTWVSDCFSPLWTKQTKFRHNRTVFIQDHTESLLPYNNIQTLSLS